MICYDFSEKVKAKLNGRNKMESIFGIIMILLGLFMVIFPKQSTKKEMRDDPSAVAKIRRNGFIIIGCGIGVILITICFL